jgi:thiopurine S-methyltransferase
MDVASAAKVFLGKVAHPGVASNAELWDWLWKNGGTPWVIDSVHPVLAEYIHQLTLGRTNCRIFVPLCGNTIDLKWLAEQGHHVVGLEASETAILQFFESRGLGKEVKQLEGIENGKLYTSCDGRLLIYQCDIFAISKDILGSFDCVWDKGSLVAIPPNTRQRYAEILTSILANDGRIILETVQHAETGSFHGPPYSIEEQDITDLFSVSFEWKILRRKANPEVLQRFVSVGFTKYDNVAFLLCKRST